MVPVDHPVYRFFHLRIIMLVKAAHFESPNGAEKIHVQI